MLIDPDTQTVALANNELFRLMSTSETQSIQDINLRLQEKLFQPFNYIEGLGDQDHQYKQNKLDCPQQRLTLFETLERPYVDEIFQVETIFDFQNQNFLKNQGNANETSLFDDQPEISNIFSVVAEEKNIGLKYDIQTAISDELYSDEQRIQQVLINLITNSLKFTIKGEIGIHISYDDQLQLLNFKVNDTGVGVPKEDEEKLFKLFGKLETSKNLNTKGIGLGLNICKKIVEACGGTIFLDTTYKQGASFCFSIQDQELFQSLYMSVNESLIDKADFDYYISNQGQTLRKLMDHDLSPVSLELSPINNQQQSQQLLTPRISLQNDQAACFCDSNQQSQILIVDDNIFNIITLQAIIEMQFNLKVDKATNGQEGIDKVVQRYEQEKQVNQTRRKYGINQQKSDNFNDFQNNYKIIFMDCNMPIMDGFEATKAIRKLQFIDQQKTQIVALTANTNDSIKIQCLEAGMDDFLTKPVSAATIKDILYKHKLLT
eukprot:403342980